jgi:hypothetical protein
MGDRALQSSFPILPRNLPLIQGRDMRGTEPVSNGAMDAGCTETSFPRERGDCHPVRIPLLDQSLVWDDPAAWLERSAIAPRGPVEIIDSDITTLTAITDKLIEIPSPFPTLLCAGL